MWAAGYGHLDIVKMLVNHGAKLDAKDNRSYDASAIAEKNNHQGVVKFLEKQRESN